jgi:hypothetical protein
MLHIRSTFQGKPDHFALYESGSEFGEACERAGVAFRAGDWYGGEGREGALRKLTLGDNALVGASEGLLESFQDCLPSTPRFRNVEDVVGALPNVPAFLAGAPQSMRRKQRAVSESAPISVITDVTSSAAISASDLLKRGAALLAFVRVLSAHRAVTLWCGIGLDGKGGGSSMVLWRIDTAPLDLARAAHLLSAPSVSRGLGYGLSYKLHGGRGGWPFGSHERQAKTGQERLQAVLGEQVHFIPPLFVKDELIKAPVSWLQRELARYLPVGEG